MSQEPKDWQAESLCCCTVCKEHPQCLADGLGSLTAHDLQQELAGQLQGHLACKSIPRQYDSTVVVLGIGNIEIIMETLSSLSLGTFKDVLYVSGLTKNLLSMSRSAINGVRAFFDVHEC